MPKLPELTTKSPAKPSSRASSIDARIEALMTRKNATTPTPIMRAWAVADVRLGLRPTFWRASAPVTPNARSGAPSTLLTGRASPGPSSSTPANASGHADAHLLQLGRRGRRRPPRATPSTVTTTPADEAHPRPPAVVDRHLAHGGQRRHPRAAPRRQVGGHDGDDHAGEQGQRHRARLDGQRVVGQLEEGWRTASPGRARAGRRPRRRLRPDDRRLEQHGHAAPGAGWRPRPEQGHLAGALGDDDRRTSCR